MTQEPANYVVLRGELSRIKSGQGQKAAWAFASIQPDGGKSRLDVKAFKEAATALAGAGDGAAVRLVGHLERQKKKDSEVWEQVVVVDQVTVIGSARQPGEDVDF